ncbi:ferric reductase-like transmembrane domain-containing protein [Streptomyces sp. NPDC001262]|uniref:ferredoxin reductase family protein n=1 Tax=Streptomyces TaxID=1883 RepID=UPI003689BB03
MAAADPAVSPRVLGTALAAGAVAVSGLWAAGVQPVWRADALWSAAARWCGLLGGYGILVMLFLMARVPAVEHGVGADRLARWHARGGRPVLSLCVAHAVFAALGHAAAAGLGPVEAAVALQRYPAIAAASVGTLLLLLVGAVSARAVRRRVSHETWSLVHLFSYTGGALGFLHQLAGPDVSASDVNLWVWSLLHSVVAVVLVWYRAVVPVALALRHRLRVTEVLVEAPGVVTVVMAGRRVRELGIAPGQFCRWRFADRRLWRTALPLSLSAPADGDRLRITVKAAGDHTRRLRRLRPGTRVFATGPFGALTARRHDGGKALLLAGGIGITPLRALFETMPTPPGGLTLLYRASYEGQLVLRRELEAIAERRGAELHYLLGRRSEADPLAPAALLSLVPDLAERTVFLCGPPGMVDAVKAALARNGVPERRIHSESFML